MTALRQVRMKDADLITSEVEEGFDKAFDKIRPVIQGVADTEVEDAKIQKNAAGGVELGLNSSRLRPRSSGPSSIRLNAPRPRPRPLRS
jgi:hypothetical protein